MLDPQTFEIDPTRGFLPSKDPLEQLPAQFAAWEEITDHLPLLLTAGKSRQQLGRLQTVDPSPLDGHPQLMRAFLLLSVMANTYIMGDAEQATVLPRQLALPLHQVAERLGLPPVFTYASMIMNNWSRIDKTGPIDLDNLTIQRSYLGCMDEHWFYLCMAVIEAKGGAAIKAIADARQAMLTTDDGGMELCLQRIANALDDILTTLNRLPEKCDPYIFYRRVRPILAAWESPVIYEDVSAKPQMWIAASAAQSTLFHALDIALGIDHPGGSGAFLRSMRAYMPPAHRQFLVKLEAGDSLRHYVQNRWHALPALATVYDECIHRLEIFRKRHIDIAVRYVSRQASGGDQTHGTSGTDFVRFLGQVRKNTASQFMQNTTTKCFYQV